MHLLIPTKIISAFFFQNQFQGTWVLSVDRMTLFWRLPNIYRKKENRRHYCKHNINSFSMLKKVTVYAE